MSASTHHATVELVLVLKPAISVKPVDAPLALSNHLNSRVHQHLNPDAEGEDEAGEAWENDTYERQEEMLKVLQKLAKRRRVHLDRVFVGLPDPILNELTAYCLLMNFRTGRTLVQTE